MPSRIKTIVVSTRFTPEEFAVAAGNAERNGRLVSTYLRELALTAPTTTVRYEALSPFVKGA
jgi:hypothetical protein